MRTVDDILEELCKEHIFENEEPGGDLEDRISEIKEAAVRALFYVICQEI